MKNLCLFFLFLTTIPLFSKEVTRTYDFSYINEFVYIGAGKFEIKQSDRNRLTLTAEETLMNNTLFSSKQGVLSLAPKDPFVTYRFPDIVRGILEIRDLSKITLNGSIAVDIDHFKADQLIIDMQSEGSSLLEGFLELENLILRIEGSAEAVIRGTANTQSIFITGAGTYNGSSYTTKKTTVHIQGAGTAFVNATDILNALIIGYGHVHYVGTPKIFEKITGEGKISPFIEGSDR